MSFVLCKHTPVNRYIPMACALLNNAKDVVAIEDIEDAFQRCYLDAASFNEPLDVLEKNFAEFASQMSAYKLIEHLPSYEPVEEKPVEKKPVEEQPKVQETVAKSGVSAADKERFLSVLDKNLMGEELADEIVALGLPALPEFMYILLDFIVGSNDVTSFIKTKNDVSQFVPFRLSNYGNLIYMLYDNCDLEVHTDLLNQVVKFWSEKDLPAVGLGVVSDV